MEDVDKVSVADGHIHGRVAMTSTLDAGRAAPININNKIAPTRRR